MSNNELRNIISYQESDIDMPCDRMAHLGEKNRQLNTIVKFLADALRTYVENDECEYGMLDDPHDPNQWCDNCRHCNARRALDVINLKIAQQGEE